MGAVDWLKIRLVPYKERVAEMKTRWPRLGKAQNGRGGVIPWLVSLLVGLITLLPAPVWAETGGIQARDLTRRGSLEVGMATGYWQDVNPFGNEPSANRSAVFVLPRVGMMLTDAFEAGPLTGNLELMVEPFFARFVQPFAAEAAGGSLVLKYNFLSFGRWMPFWDVGAGMLWTNLAPRIPEQSTQFNFALETGPGVQYFVSKTVGLTLGVRFHHISNAGLGDRNIGLNAVLPYFGVSFFLPR